MAAGGTMGFYFRQSARLGPFRINFSKSGIGLSAGIPGFRIGTGPRGAYVHAGMAGLYYRQSLGGVQPQPRSSSGRSSMAPETSPRNDSPYVPPIEVTLGAEERIDSGSVLQMRDSSGANLIDELQACRNRTAMAPFAWVVAGLCLATAWWQHSVALAILGVVLLPLAYWLRMKDIARKGFVVQYELDAGAEEAAGELVEALEGMSKAGRVWYLDSTTQVLDRKYHAGASNVVKRTGTRVSFEEPPYLRTNVPVPGINMGKETLYFLPDRLLVYAGSAIGAVSYAEVQIKAQDSRFIEESRSALPHDAEVVGATWRYVNKKGGPDRRFKDNPELPIALYEELSLSSASGLREVLQISKRGLGEKLARAISHLNGATANGRVAVRKEAPGTEGEPALQGL